MSKSGGYLRRTPCGANERPPNRGGSGQCRRPRRLSGFSLIELVIAMGILALGMIMVASMFPVAWTRARQLSEYTVHKTVRDIADATVKSIARVSGPGSDASSFLGDLIYDPYNNNVPISGCPGGFYPTDTWLHALNLENIQIADRRFVSEDPWEMQDPVGRLFDAGDPDTGNLTGGYFIENSYFRRQISFHQRVYPPMRPRENFDLDSGLPDPANPDAQWDDDLTSRRYAYAVLHRLREQISFDANNLETLSVTRTIDLYYVTLRRAQPTFRYAKQDPKSAPNPCYLAEDRPVVPAPLPPEKDLMFPVPWRVQIEIPDSPLLPSRDDPTGVPTEIIVPPTTLPTSDTSVKAMLVQMFPTGAQFVDEVNGQVYRVVKRRLTGANDDQAFLTLDREVFAEDIDLPCGDPRCDTCICKDPTDPTRDEPAEYVDSYELLRTVWVFPPPAEAKRARSGKVLLFQGSQPTIGIDIRTLNIAPTG